MPSCTSTTLHGGACQCCAGFLLALLTDRCFFIHFDFYHASFVPELDFTWATQKRRLLAFGHDVDAAPPLGLGFWFAGEASAWLLQDQKQLYAGHYGITLSNDPDYSAALLQANPHHAGYLRRLFPTGEMFHALAPLLLKVGAAHWAMAVRTLCIMPITTIGQGLT